MSQAGLEPAIPASERLQTHALDRVATDSCKQGLGLLVTNSTLLNPRVYKIALIQYINITLNSKPSIRKAVCDTAHPATHMGYQRITYSALMWQADVQRQAAEHTGMWESHTEVDLQVTKWEFVIQHPCMWLRIKTARRQFVYINKSFCSKTKGVGISLQTDQLLISTAGLCSI
jgi:hypothetical protein